MGFLNVHMITDVATDLVLTHDKYSPRPDGLQGVIPSKGATFNLDPVHIKLEGVSEVVVGDADVPPPVKGRHLPVPAAELCASFASSA